MDMKKSGILFYLLVAIPVLAVVLAAAGDSVMVFDTVTKETQYYSYFDILPVAKLAMLTPLSALLAAASGISAAVYMAKKKEGAMKATGYLALAAACIAVIPNILREQVMVIPNVGLPLLLFAEYVLTCYLGKQKWQEEKKNKQQERLPLKRR